VSSSHSAKTARPSAKATRPKPSLTCESPYSKDGRWQQHDAGLGGGALTQRGRALGDVDAQQADAPRDRRGPAQDAGAPRRQLLDRREVAPVIARLRAAISSRFRRPMRASTSEGALPQIVV
jgi:hypothetical protein